MFTYFHCFFPETWKAQADSGLVRDGDGIRFCQSRTQREDRKFNRLAARGSELYRLERAERRPMYIDRLQGGCFIDDYRYDTGLLRDYRELLGDGFFGFQMHEWLSNYGSDLKKLGQCEPWTAENITAEIKKQFPYDDLFLESMTAEELAGSGSPVTAREFLNNMTGIYLKRQREYGELIPCDSSCLAFPFELKSGARHIMAEIGAQTPDARIQICYARGMAAAYGAAFGAYYEPWGGSPFSACCCKRDGENEWGLDESGKSTFPFHSMGENGGSSRSLQMRLHLYAYLSGAELMSEEWGMCNLFYDWHSFDITPYGRVKRDFLAFVDKYPDVGEKIAPAAVVLPAELPVLENVRSPRAFCGYPLNGSEADGLAAIKNTVCEIFSSPTEMRGDEIATLINSDMPDAVDIFGGGSERASNKYDILIDLTGDASFAAGHKNCRKPSELAAELRRLLPVWVEGGLHWLLNKKSSGGYYLTVFNHSGVTRSVEGGEKTMPEEEKTARIFIPEGMSVTPLEGNAEVRRENGDWHMTVPPGGWCFAAI